MLITAPGQELLTTVMTVVVVVMGTIMMVMSNCITLLQNTFYYCWQVDSWVELIIGFNQSISLTL